MRDMYALLGVPRDADQAAIKKAFKKLAREFHPDRNKNPGAEARFKEVSAAYEVLGDEQKRALYDEFGELALRPGFDPEQARAWKRQAGAFGGAAGGLHGFPGAGAGFDFQDLFGSLFRGGGRRRPSGAERGPDLRAELWIDLLAAVQGGTIPLSLQRPGACPACEGKGGKGRRPCPACKGSGRVRMRALGMDALVGCDTCGGDGAVFSEECASCAGTGRSMRPVRLSVKVPAGVDEGSTIRLRGQGGEGRRGGPPGNLLLEVHVKPHPILSRDGDDLQMELPITFGEALAGARVLVPTPWGDVRVNVPAGAASGTRLRLKERGVARKGDLLLVLRPTPPHGGSRPDPELVARLDSLYSESPRAGLAIHPGGGRDPGA